MKNRTIPSISAQRALEKFGRDIANARKRRRLTQQRLADGAGVAVPTIRRLEAGDPGTSIGTIAMVLVALGEASRLENLLDAGSDDIGLVLGAQSLPQRVRARGKPSPAVKAEPPPRGQDEPDFGEAF